MKQFLLVTGGRTDDSFAKAYIAERTFEVCIAADSGMEFFYRNQMKPDVIIGDFDSVDARVLAYFYAQEGIRFEKLNPVKDDTDTEAAIRLAIQMGAESITILGATGSRLDHVLGNIELLGIGLQNHVPIIIVDKYNRIRMTDNPVVIPKEEQFGEYISLLPYTRTVEGLTLAGMKYPLHNAILHGFCSLGISNEIIGDEAVIQFEKGILLIIEARENAPDKKILPKDEKIC